MSTNVFAKGGFNSGSYYLVDRETVEKIYEDAGYTEEDEIPNFMVINDIECLFTENYIEKDGKEYEIVMVANGFSWADIVIYEASENEEHDEHGH